MNEAPSRDNVGKMFDRIAGRYDLLNHLLSGGQDIIWRRCLARELAAQQPRDVLDLATGTGDQLFTLLRRCPSIERGIGIDISPGMLGLGWEKCLEQQLQGRVRMMVGDAMHLPMQSASCDAVTISFGIRNVADFRLGLREMHRVLRPGGRAYILEFGLPANRFLRRSYLLYFRHVLPILGGLVSGDSYAYRYLNKTVETFPYGGEFAAIMGEAGFSQTRLFPMTFGVVYLYVGEKA